MSVIKNIKTSEIKKYSKEDFSTAFNQLQNWEILKTSKEIRLLILWILELSKKFKIDRNTPNFKEKLLYKMSKSDNLEYVWIADIVSSIIYWEKTICLSNNSCQDKFETELYSREVNFVWDIQEWWKVMRVSRNIEKILWYNHNDFISWKINFSEIIHKDDLEKILNEVKEYSEKKVKSFEQEYRVIKKDWESIIVKDQTIVKYDKQWNIKYFYWYIYDITEQKEMEEYIKWHAYYDNKTWLPNDIQLQKDIEEIKWNKIIIILKINNFKDINTTYSFAEWDKILLNISEKLKKIFWELWFTLYKSWQLNFWLFKSCEKDIHKNNCISEDTEEEKNKIIKIIENIIKDFSIDYKYWELPIKISGWLAFQKDASFDKALHALYTWHNTWWITIYDDELEQTIKEESESKLKWAKKISEWLEKWYFIPYYQWIRNNETWKIDKYEALVRYKNWNDFFSPYFFLRIAEKLNLLQKISERMIKEVIREMKRHNYSISINLTEKDFLNNELIKLIKKELKNNKIHANRLTIEVLENITEEWNITIVKNIKILKKFWINISIDDFWTWHSNFSRLLDISPDYLKIDWSLIKWIVWKNSHKYWKILRSIIEFWHNQWAKIIAEYVENQHIQDKLDVLWVDYSQWYHYSKPSRDIKKDS